MLDGVTLDQLRTFLAVVDEGSFSAAGRRLGRAQSVVSHTLSTMEGRLGIRLFERIGRYPVLTKEGRSLVTDARGVIEAMASFRRRATHFSAGLEPEVTFTVDAMMPLDPVTRAVAAFEATFPATALRLSVEALGAVIYPVIAGRDAFAIAGPMALEHGSLSSVAFPGVPMVAAVAPGHPIARDRITLRDLSDHRQLVLSDRSELSRDREFGVLSSRTWRTSDLGAKRALLKAGLGWGAMPRAMIAEDLKDGSLVALDILDTNPAWTKMPMHIVYPVDRPPGIAGRWLVDRLLEEAAAPSF